MHRVFFQGMALLAGLVIGINAALLRPNPAYEPSWSNVFIALVFWAMFSAMAHAED